MSISRFIYNDISDSNRAFIVVVIINNILSRLTPYYKGFG